MYIHKIPNMNQKVTPVYRGCGSNSQSRGTNRGDNHATGVEITGPKLQTYLLGIV